MDTVIKENYEKVLLAILLLILAVTSIVSILMVRSLPPINHPDGGNAIEVNKVPNFELAAVKINVEDGPNSLELFTYCRNSECNYLISKSFQKCNWCSTPVISQQEISDDQNRNGISDKLELTWGLVLDDPKELLRDQDKDGYSTIVEYERSFSPVDSSSHPPLILRASFSEIETKYIPFKLNDIVSEKDIKGNIKVYVDAEHSTRGGFYLLVGEETSWLKILAAGEEKGRKYALLKYFEKEVKIFKDQKTQYDGWPKYIIHNHLNNKKVKVSLGDEFNLRSVSGGLETYKLKSLNRATKSLVVIDKQVDSKYEVKRKPILEAPLD